MLGIEKVSEDGHPSGWDRLNAALAGGVVRRSVDLAAAGIGSRTIAAALSRGRIVRPMVGTYHLAGTGIPPWKTGLAAACARAPRSVVCLATAALLAGLADRPPAIVWLAIPNDLRGLVLDPVPHRLVGWSWNGAFDIGVGEVEVCGVPTRTTGPARTVVDMFRYARHLGGDAPALAALRRFMAQADGSDELRDMARQTGMPAAAATRLEAAIRAARKPSRRSRRPAARQSVISMRLPAG